MQQSDVAVGGSIRRSKLAYAVWVAFMPGVTFALTFALLCAWECTVGPWFTFFIAPAAVLILWLVSVAVYARWSYRLPQLEGESLRRYIALSVLWAPILAGLVALVVSSVVSGAVSLAGW